MSSILRKKVAADGLADTKPPSLRRSRGRQAEAGGSPAAPEMPVATEVARPFLRQGGHQDKLLNLPVARIRTNTDQPRKHFDPDALRVLARSIQEEGLLQPVSVRPLENGDDYVLVAGERRLQAIRDILGWTTIAARIYRGSNPAGAALAENLVRADLNLVEKAEALERYRAEAPNGPLSTRRVQDELGVSLAQISRLNKVAQLPEEIKAPIRDGRVTLPMTRLEALAEIADPARQIEAFRQASREGAETATAGAGEGGSADRSVAQTMRRPSARGWEPAPYFERTMTNARRLNVRLQKMAPYGRGDLGERDLGDELEALEELRGEIDRFLARHRAS